jgi:uncharacterized membrane protein
MAGTSNLWAVVFDDPASAAEARATVCRLQDAQCLGLDDVLLVTRLPDGSFKLDRDPCPVLGAAGCGGLFGLLAGLVAGQPLLGAAAGAAVGGALAVVGARVVIDEAFVREVEALMTPGASVLFVRDEWGDREVILHQLRGTGGKVLKTNVDPEWAKQVQASLDTPRPAPNGSD